MGCIWYAYDVFKPVAHLEFISNSSVTVKVLDPFDHSKSVGKTAPFVPAVRELAHRYQSPIYLRRDGDRNWYYMDLSYRLIKANDIDVPPALKLLQLISS